MDTILSDMLADEIRCVSDTGRTDMSDINAVIHKADEFELYHLAVWLDERENHTVYMNFILKGRWS